MNDSSNNISKQLDIKIPDNFVSGRNYIPLAQINSINGQNLPAIGNYSEPPQSGTYVLAAKDGQIQWLATQDCNELP